MIHRPWPYTQRLVDRMADSSLQDSVVGSLQRPPRSEGLHVSTLLKLLHPVEDRDALITEEQLRVYGLLGLAFEDRAELALLSLAKDADWPFDAFRPGEVDYDGVAGSPDILLVPKDGSAFFEISLKCKWKSCFGLPTETEGQGGFGPKWDYDLSQCMAYGTPLDTLKSVLLVYFVNGNYRGPKNPQVHAWELEYTPRERAETWSALMNIKHSLEDTDAR